jgi:arylsulfatase A-like enzyme
MEKQKQQEPFFMALGIIRPHTPLVVPDKYFDMFPLDQIQVPERQENDLADTNYHQGGPKDSRGAQIYQALKANSNGTDEGLRRYTQAYLASIAFADDMLGQAMSALENSAYKDNTIVVVFSDHGYQIGEKDHLWKYTLWEDSTHVPFIIKHPKYKHQAGKQVQHPISLIDVFPTLKDFCDLQGPTKLNESGAELDGFSLKSFLENPETESWNGPDFAMTITDSYKSKLPKDQHIAIRTKHYRYIHYQNGTEELYDHRRDSNEWTNLASNPEYAQIKKQLKNDMFESLKNKKEPVITSKSNKTKSDAEKWKDTYFKKNPAADTNKDGVLSWPEYKKHKE